MAILRNIYVRHLTLKVLFESCMLRECKYQFRNRCRNWYISYTLNDLMAYELDAKWRSTLAYISSSQHDDVMVYANPKDRTPETHLLNESKQNECDSFAKIRWLFLKSDRPRSMCEVDLDIGHEHLCGFQHILETVYGILIVLKHVRNDLNGIQTIWTEQKHLNVKRCENK